MNEWLKYAPVTVSIPISYTIIIYTATGSYKKNSVHKV